MEMMKWMSISLILVITLVGGFFPFFKKYQSSGIPHFPRGESIAAGVFMGAGLIHMLGDASKGFYALHLSYPFAFLLAGGTFFLLLFLEHIGQEIYKKRGSSSALFATLATFMLCIHSFLTGIALGLSQSLSIMFMLLLAVLAHKWAESFALAVQLQKSSLSFKTTLFLFVAFSLMVPLGILVGQVATTMLQGYPWLEPTFSALAAGTFLYLGTLHGLERATLITQCCNLNRFFFVIGGFSLMAIVAIWT